MRCHTIQYEKRRIYTLCYRSFQHGQIKTSKNCDLAVSANNNLAHDFAKKNENTDNDGKCEMSFIVSENNRGGTPKPLEEYKKNSLNISVNRKINFFH